MSLKEQLSSLKAQNIAKHPKEASFHSGQGGLLL